MFFLVLNSNHTLESSKKLNTDAQGSPTDQLTKKSAVERYIDILKSHRADSKVQPKTETLQ